jgi:hypothetical protein
MKKFCVVLLLFCSIKAISQKKPHMRLNLYAGYVFDDRVDNYSSDVSYYEGVIEGSIKWGAGLEYIINNEGLGLELIYLREDTEGPTTYYDDNAIGNPIKSREFDLAINYILFGGNQNFQLTPVFEPYFGLQMGVGIFNVSNPTNGKETNRTKFAWSMKGGTNIWASKKIGIKLQANLLSIVQAAGGEVYFGSGGGSGISGYSSILQFSLGGGLVFRFGK